MKQRNYSNNRFDKAANATASKDSVALKEEIKKKTNFFTVVHAPTQALKARVNEHLTGEREIRGRAARPGHLKLSAAPDSMMDLTRNSRVLATIDAKVTQPIFKEVPFWSNLNEESIMSGTITATARAHKHHNSTLPTDRTLAFDTKRSMFNQNDQSAQKGGGDQTLRGFLGGPSQNTYETSGFQDTSRF